MDALRLVEAGRHALAQARGVQDVVAEAWQAQALVEAVGSHLAVHGRIGTQAAAFALSEAGSKACGSLHHPGTGVGRVRALGLTGVKDPPAVLRALRALLDEAGVALVGVACSVEDEPVYWQCIDAVDAADDSKDRLADLLRLLGDPGVPGEESAAEDGGSRSGAEAADGARPRVETGGARTRVDGVLG
ncbi:DUF6099 family protein [Wenjunlia tyrosinilytica]|uniref:Uncharacterized protein n=1 Tax=Wenjunlia tyrosinilytica TaxID=1544741 RepID=A0A917ZT02_9ACTN|nr:DUF6099 family protein [Wenjunlia tyrosinilytica]GGO91159.1 hypothetical protein GCM10012280_38350 [Wenjunlia tyrosinilytica]